MSRQVIGIIVFVAALLPGVVTAQPSAGEVYVVQLRELAAVDEPEVVAAQIASAARGEVLRVEGRVATLRLSPAQARMVASDPRVEAVTLSSATRAVTAAAETMPWSSGVAYEYDGSGNVRKIGTDAFLYDAAGRLVQSDTNGTRRNYEYDAYGNRTRCRESEGTPAEGDCQYGFNADPATNRLSGVAYDAAGNVTALGSHSYTYDAVNMQTRDASTSLVREFVYTADDERLAVYTVGAGWRWTVRDASGKVLREFTSSDGPNGAGTANWQWSKDYIWRDGLLLASKQREGGSTTTYHYHLDHLGTPRRITDDTDGIVGTHDYFPFGTEAGGGQNEPSLSLLKFTGHERDLLFGESWETLDYMHARFESATLGRFLSVDPGRDWDPGKPQSWNMYTYVRNSPINATDPSGMYTTNCADGDNKCAADASAFENARQANLNKEGDEYADLRSAAAAYGAPGEENGVVVTFVPRVLDAQTGKPLNANGGTTAELLPGESVRAQYAVQIKSGLDAVALGNAVVHEGTHVSNAQSFVRQLQQGIVDTSMTLYQTEMNAYMVTALYAKSENARIPYNGMTIVPQMPREQIRQEIDRFLRKSGVGPDVRRCQFSGFC